MPATRALWQLGQSWVHYKDFMKFPYLLFVSNFYNMEKEAHFTHVTSWQLFNITYNYNLYTLILWQSTNIWHQVPMAQKPTHHWHAPLVPWYSCLASRSNLRTSRRHQACWWWVRDVAVEDPQIHCFMVCLLGNHTELGAFYLGPAFFFEFGDYIVLGPLSRTGK